MIHLAKPVGQEGKMAGHAVKRIDEMEAVFGGGFKRARAELGVESFGMQIIDMPPNYDNYPEHDHSEDGQEEVYVTLRGGGELEIEGERFPLDDDRVARVGPGVKRKVWPGEDGIRVLVIGGKAGEAYEAPDVTKLGEPDPMAS
jgi:mannose-6-phosphate isomerase-like protein (cupin superfamily)